MAGQGIEAPGHNQFVMAVPGFKPGDGHDALEHAPTYVIRFAAWCKSDRLLVGQGLSAASSTAASSTLAAGFVGSMRKIRILPSAARSTPTAGATAEGLTTP